MKAKHLILTLAAVAGLSVACKPKDEPLPAASIAINPSALTFEKEGGSQTLTLTATRDWTVSNDADWIAVEPKSGKASNDARTVTVRVLENKGVDREASVKFTIGLDSKTLSVKQAGAGSTEELLVYFNNFDKEAATRTYGTEGKYWPMLDQFEGWKNQTGKGAANVEYAFAAITARNNSASNGTHSAYPGSGVNNLFFGKENFFKVAGIALESGKTDYTLSFGTEKYLKDADNTFNPAEFQVYVSADGKKWVELSYKFPGAFQNGKWDLASSSFSVPAGTATLSIGFISRLASAHRLDDLKLEAATAAGNPVDFSKGVEVAALSGPKPAVPVTIAEAAKADKGTAVILENVLVYAKNKFAVVVGDATGFIVVYDKGGVNANVGDKITVEGAIGLHGGLKQVTDPRITAGTTGNALTYPAAKEIAAIADYKPAATAPEYVTLKGTLKVSDNHYNIVVDGATRQGSIQAPLDGAVPADLNGKLVVVTGFFSGFAGSDDKYVNIMMTKIETTAGSFLSADKTAITVEPTATSATFNITSNVDWTAKAETAGVSLDKTSGNGNATVTATFPANTSTTADVVMTITLSGTGVNPVTVTITQKKVIAALTHPLTTNIPEADFTVSKENSSFIDAKVTVNGSTDQYFALKLGTSKKSGKATVKLPAGTKRIGFFAVGWKGSKVKLTAAMGALGSQSRDNIRANVGATGNAPYKLVDIFENPVGDSHYFEIVFPADKLPNGLPMDVDVEVSSSPKTGTDARAIIFGINIYK